MSQTEPGWYQAAGDPPGTQRWWDGTSWQGDPVPVAQSTTRSTTPSSEPSPPPGYVAFAQPDAQPAPVYAGWGQRFVAYLIDVLPIIAIYIVGFGLIAAIGVAGLVIFLAAAFAFVIWNLVLRQGRTGQSIGKQRRGLRLISDATREPPGAGAAFGRYLVAGLLSNFSFGIYGLLDYLWPLWDKNNKRLTDKMFKLSVVVA
ncbi:MAG: RDD family protein [Actinomycetota bacterium]